MPVGCLGAVAAEGGGEIYDLEFLPTARRACRGIRVKAGYGAALALMGYSYFKNNPLPVSCT